MAWPRIAGVGICNFPSVAASPLSGRGRDDCKEAGGGAIRGAIAEGWGRVGACGVGRVWPCCWFFAPWAEANSRNSNEFWLACEELSPSCGGQGTSLLLAHVGRRSVREQRSWVAGTSGVRFTYQKQTKTKTGAAGHLYCLRRRQEWSESPFSCAASKSALGYDFSQTLDPALANDNGSGDDVFYVLTASATVG